ncbi:quinoprotein relay system zinc metallohydrolase 2 [Roseovarius marisflavi]|uniref:Quinoprotein relay system zinc metallohydrolase 2 n=1 Tax=Roseovarius marisflavi TaxID=1054996 RepID=A0A1M7A9B8_9RHOB|nr:quinoprotein relay system zinc metallohydrolase 2 [Roseovarius marisflavi]SHL39301.1 quinoprotein relay system zinc metallohydrolase 2 [Roseovarius marisflavi]
MFEILTSLCLVGQPDACQTRLVPVDGPDCDIALARAAELAPEWGADFVAGPPECTARRASRLEFSEIAPGVYVHRGEVADVAPENLGDVVNIGFVIGRDSVAVIDSGGSRAIGEEVYLAVRAITPKPISHIILTHMHPDHVFGATVLAEAGAEIIGHRKLGQALNARAETYETNFARLIGPGFSASRTPLAITPVSDSTVIDLGTRALTLVPWETAHSESDLTVFDTATATLFAGDLLFDEHSPALDGSLLGWLRVLDAMGTPPPARVVPGHGGPVLDWPEGGVAVRRYLETLRDETRIAVADGLRLSEAVATVGKGEADNWHLFDLFHRRNVTAAFTELEWE